VWGPVGASPDELRLSAQLADDLRAWQREWEQRWGSREDEPQDHDQYAAWKAEGHALVRRLRDELSHRRYEVIADF